MTWPCGDVRLACECMRMDHVMPASPCRHAGDGTLPEYLRQRHTLHFSSLGNTGYYTVAK